MTLVKAMCDDGNLRDSDVFSSIKATEEFMTLYCEELGRFSEQV